MKNGKILQKAGVLIIMAAVLLSTVTIAMNNRAIEKKIDFYDSPTTDFLLKESQVKNPSQREQIILEESFTDGIPEDWSQELVVLNYYWDKYYGGWDWGSGKIPPAPHTDPWNVMFEPTVGPEGAITKLVTPSLDLSEVTLANLTFWYAIAEDETVQPEHTGQEIITVYYKTSSGGSWVPVPGGHFEDDTPEWTEVTLTLPNPSGDYFIAFEGEYHWGYGACLDDVVVYDPFGTEPLIADANGPYEGIVGEEVQFTGSATGGVPPYIYSWDLDGDGEEDSTDQNPTFTYDAADVYTVNLTVADTGGEMAFDETTATIENAPEPKPDLEITSIEGGKGITVTVENTGDGDATNVSWTITIEGGFIILPREGTDLFATIPAGESEEFSMSVLGIGLGIIFDIPTITVSVECNEDSSDEASVEAKILFSKVTIQ